MHFPSQNKTPIALRLCARRGAGLVTAKAKGHRHTLAKPVNRGPAASGHLLRPFCRNFNVLFGCHPAGPGQRLKEPTAASPRRRWSRSGPENLRLTDALVGGGLAPRRAQQGAIPRGRRGPGPSGFPSARGLRLRPEAAGRPGGRGIGVQPSRSQAGRPSRRPPPAPRSLPAGPGPAAHARVGRQRPRLAAAADLVHRPGPLPRERGLGLRLPLLPGRRRVHLQRKDKQR